jgi:Ca-activated chloride channel family protein
VRAVGLAIAAALLALAGIVALASADRGGRMLLAFGMPDAAAAVLRDPAWRGVALHRAGRFAEATAALRRTRSPEAAYNLGNAFARAGDLALAIKAYDIALRRDPNDADARANRALVDRLMRARAADGRKSAGNANARAVSEHAGGDTAASDENGDTQSSFGDGMAGQREAGSSGETQGTSRVDRRGDATEGDMEDGAASSKGAATDSAGRAGRSGGLTTAASADGPPPSKAAAAAEDGQATLQWLAAIPDDPGRFVRLRIAAERQRRHAFGTAVPPGGASW